MKFIKNKSILFVLIFFCLFIFSDFANAGLVPCGNEGGIESRCTLCHLFVGIQNIITWGRNILVIVAVVAIVAGGIMYIISAGDEKMMSSAKGIIKQALWGVLIVLGAWVIVNTVMLVLGTNLNALSITSSWNEFSCSTAVTVGSGTSATTTSGCTINYSPWTPTPCTPGDTQTRTETSRVPAGCTGTTPVLSRTCSSASFTCSDDRCEQVNDAIENNTSGVDPNILKAVVVGGEGCSSRLSTDGHGSCGYSQALPSIRSWCGITGTEAETCAKIQADVNLDMNCAARLIASGNSRCNATDIMVVASCYNTGQPGQCYKATANYCGRVSTYLNNCN